MFDCLLDCLSVVRLFVCFVFDGLFLFVLIGRAIVLVGLFVFVCVFVCLCSCVCTCLLACLMVCLFA